MGTSKKFARAVKVFVATLLVLAIFTTLVWGVTSSWGSVRLSRTEFVGNGGATQSGWMFTPKGVNEENPAPAIVDFHGRNTTAYNLVAWAIEQSRRGYVVFLPDQENTNESLSTEDNTTARIAVSAVDYMLSQDFVTEVSVAGHSMGNVALAALNEAVEVQKQLKSMVSVGNMFMMFNDVPEYTNYLSIEAQKDFYAAQWATTLEDKYARAEEQFGIEGIEDGVLYGDPEEGTARMLITQPTTHQQQMYSEDVIAAMMSFIELSSPAPNPISYDNQVFWWAYILLAICTLLCIASVAECAYMLAVSPIFAKNVITAPVASNGKSKKQWVRQVVQDFLIAILLFVPVTLFIASYNPEGLLQFGYVNQIFMWIFSVGLVGGIIMIFKYRAMSKTKQLAAADFGMGTADEKPLVWKRVRDGFIIASLTTIYLFTLLDVVCKVFGINYQFFCVFAQLNRLTPERFLLSLPYIVLGIILLVVINISIATSRRIKDSGNETKDIIKTILINIFLSAGPLTLLLAIQFIGIRLSPDGIAPLSMNLFTGLAYALGFPFMMSSSAGISAFLYKKTGNIWTGVFTSTFVLIFLTCNYGLITA